MIALNMPEDGPRREVTRHLCRRILALIKNHPEILKSEAHVLMSFEEFEYGDLKPTLVEVVMAFKMAIRMWKVQQDLEKP